MHKFLSPFSAVAVASGLLLALHGCKKDDPNIAENPDAAVWAPQVYEVNEYYAGSDHKRTVASGDHDYLSLGADGKCSGRLYPLGKFTGAWRMEGNQRLVIEQATVENAYLLDEASKVTFELIETNKETMQIRLRLNKVIGVGYAGVKINGITPLAASSPIADYTEIGTTLTNLYNESIGRGYARFGDQHCFIKRTEAANKDMFGNVGFYIYGYGVDLNGNPMQLFISWSAHEVHAGQNIVFGSKGLTLLHVQWFKDNGQIIESSERTFGADGQQIRMSSDNRDAFILHFENLTEMDKWNDRPMGNGISASGFLRGNPVNY